MLPWISAGMTGGGVSLLIKLIKVAGSGKRKRESSRGLWYGLVRSRESAARPIEFH